jgi:hypothetical protein
MYIRYSESSGGLYPSCDCLVLNCMVTLLGESVSMLLTRLYTNGYWLTRVKRSVFYYIVYTK